MEQRAIVIGAGFGGLAAALRLRAKGYDVTIIDRCERLGGRAQVFERNGYRHDAGPTVLTAPFLFAELFQLFGKQIENYVDIRALDLWYRFRFSDGSTFDYGGTVEDTLREIDKIEPADKEGYLSLLHTSQKLYETGFNKLADKPFDRFLDMLAVLPAMIRLRVYRSVWGLVSSCLKSDKLRQAFSIQPLLVGGNPFDTTCIYNLIHFLERRHGVHFAMGGTGALVDGLGKLMREEGVKIQLNQSVDEVIVEAGRAVGVRLANGTRIDSDIVVSNTDPAHLYEHMLPDASPSISARLKASHARKSMGLFVLFFGTENRQYEDVAHHTICLGPRYKGLLDDIFNNKTLAEDFSLYLHRPTATDPGFAPAGSDSFYALIPVPNKNADIDWSVEGQKLRDRCVNHLNDTILPGLKDCIVEDFWMTPDDFESNYLSPVGAGFSITPHFTQSAWFRFHNRAEGIENLYLVGAGTHPGAGLPGVVSSAKVLERIVPEPAEEAAGTTALTS